jgi:membrane associated rhomboid family serine protease
MTPTSVGMRCPECARERIKVRTARTISSRRTSVTEALIGVNVVAFLAETAAGGALANGGGGTVLAHGELLGPAIAHQHEYWRLLTGGFLHLGIFHILVNMLSLYFVGRILEPAIGRLNFFAIYMASLFAGSFGALLFQPNAPTVGASGAIFGIFGALIVVARNRGIPIWQSGLGVVLVFNLVLTLGIRGISIGGHIGGLIGGVICGWLVLELAEKRRMPGLAMASCAVVAVACIAGAIGVAGGQGLAPNGIGFGS